jgi:hypothetical protein
MIQITVSGTKAATLKAERLCTSTCADLRGIFTTPDYTTLQGIRQS